jgi:hypothetical protein
MIGFEVDVSGIVPWRKAKSAALLKAARRAGSEAVKGMRAEGSRQIRAKKRITFSRVGEALSIDYPGSPDVLSWAVRATGGVIPAFAFTPRPNKPGRTRASGVSIEINKGGRKVLAHSFIATMKSGHTGIFMRTGTAFRAPVKGYKGHGRYAGQKRQPIREIFTSGIPGVLRASAQPVADRGVALFERAFRRNMRLIP